MLTNLRFVIFQVILQIYDISTTKLTLNNAYVLQVTTMLYQVLPLRVTHIPLGQLLKQLMVTSVPTQEQQLVSMWEIIGGR